MKSFKEISENIIPLSEGLFDMDGEERVGSAIAKDATMMFLKTCKGNFTTVALKDGSVKVNGKLILSNLTTDKIYLNCKDFRGKLIIENCPELTTLEGSFLEKMAVFDGSITINQCPALVSVKGLPGLIKGDLSITNCKKLKSWEGIDMVYGNLYWQGNGKKYTPEQLKDKVHVIKKIVCGMDEIEADVVEGLVTEAFNNPWLQRLAAQFKKYPYKRYSWEKDAPNLYNNIDELFRRNGRVSSMYGRPLDKITSEDIDVYDMSNEKDKKALAKAFWDSYNAQNANGADIMLVYNEEIEEFIGGFGMISRPRGEQSAGVDWLIFPHKATKENSWDKHEGEIRSTWYTKTKAKEKLLEFGHGYTVIVINSGNDTGTGWRGRSDIKQSRQEAQRDIIKPGDVEQYKQIAAANVKRYKDLAAKIRAERKKNAEGSSEYDKIIDEYEKFNLRVIKLVRTIAKNPGQFSKYNVDSFLNWMRDEKHYNPRYKPWQKNSGPEYYGENGFIYYFKRFMECYLTCFGTGGYREPDSSDFKSLDVATSNMRQILQKADTKLKEFGF